MKKLWKHIDKAITLLWLVIAIDYLVKGEIFLTICFGVGFVLYVVSHILEIHIAKISKNKEV